MKCNENTTFALANITLPGVPVSKSNVSICFICSWYIKLITLISQIDIGDLTWVILQFITCKLSFQINFLQETCSKIINLPVICLNSIELSENSIKLVEAIVMKQSFETMILSIFKYDSKQTFLSYFSIFSVEVSYLSWIHFFKNKF